MITTSEFKRDFQEGKPVAMAIIGDSTTAGFGANSGVNKWINGISYGCMNNPTFSPNWDVSSPFVLNMAGIITQAQQDNKAIPSGTRLLRTYIESVNPLSKVYNFGAAGYTASSHVAANTMATIAALPVKPKIVFIALGINSAKNGLSQDTDIRTLVNQAISYGIRPVLVKENNIAVAFTGNGAWSDTATPDQWVAKTNWSDYRNNIDAIAKDYSLDTVDLGSANGAIDITTLYDGFHPNAKGYWNIFNNYRTWLVNGAMVINPITLSIGLFTKTGALRIKVGTNILAITLLDTPYGSLKLKTTQGIFSII